MTIKKNHGQLENLCLSQKGQYNKYAITAEHSDICESKLEWGDDLKDCNLQPGL